MAAGNWISTNTETRSARLMGVFTPVRGLDASRAKSLRGRNGSWMGTPEILFARPVDNSRLVRVTDPVRTQEMRQFTTAVACLFILVMFYAWQHYRAIEFGYRNEALKVQREMLLETNRELRLSEASLRAPERIDVLARQLGLVIPQAGQLQRLDQPADTQTPVMARAETLAAASTIR